MIDGPDLVAFVRNNAPYAWAIQTGQYTLNDLAYGTRTSNELGPVESVRQANIEGSTNGSQTEKYNPRHMLAGSGRLPPAGSRGSGL